MSADANYPPSKVDNQANEAIAVPPDQAPLRAQGDLLGTLTKLQEYFGYLWLARDVRVVTSGELELVAKLIATAVQQAEALPSPDCDAPGCLLQGIAHTHDKVYGPICAECAQTLLGPKPEGDLAAWRERMTELLNEFRPVGGILAVRDHLAAMPAQPRVHVGLLEALKATRNLSGHYRDCPDMLNPKIPAEACEQSICKQIRAAIDVDEEGAAG